MIIAISFALALFLSMFLVPLGIRYADVLGLVDQPDDNRKVHAKPIPRVGGLAMAIAFFIPAGFWLHDEPALFGLLLGSLVIVVFGFLDDRHDLDYKWKFLGQFLAVAIFLAGNVEVTKTPFFGLGDGIPWLSYPLLTLFILGVTNAINLSDGLDGLAAGSSLLSLGFIAVLAYAAQDHSYAIVAVSAMGALTGFLRFNTHPASVFMGDAGSQFLGFVTACLVIQVTQSESLAVSPVLPLLIVGLPIFDTLMVMALRLRSGDSPFKPDQRHLHHQLLKSGLAHYQAVASIYLLNFSLLIIAFVIRFESDYVVTVCYLLFCLVAIILLSSLKMVVNSRGIVFQRGQKEDRRNPWVRHLSWMHFYGVRVVQTLLGIVWLVYLSTGLNVTSSANIALSMALVAMTLFAYFGFPNSRLLARIIFYSLSVMAAYTISYDQYIDLPNWRALLLPDVILGLMIVSLAAAIRTTRRELFRMDTQDVLVLLVLLAAPLVTLGFGEDKSMTGAILRLAVMLYATEFVITRANTLKTPLLFSVFGAITYFVTVLI